MERLKPVSADLKQYLMITGNYWAFTLTDGALRMLVVLHFHQLGYQPLQIAMLFLFYEIFGIVSNLLGGWLGAVIGLNRIMHIGLGLQIIALSMLLVPSDLLSMFWVMLAQAISGIAKDLNKMSAKSAIKLLVPKGADAKLYQWVALLTGSKNTLKGVGFFLGAGLLGLTGFHDAILYMASALVIVWILSIIFLKQELGKATIKPKFKQLLSNRPEINRLSLARLFLFAARDVWFVVALPVYLSSSFGWDFWAIGGFIASWVIGYGIIQSLSPKITGSTPSSKAIYKWAAILSISPLIIGLALYHQMQPLSTLLLGLIVFGFIFAINSSLHSYFIVQYANKESVSMDVGFYYMANAGGRLLGTVLSGWVFQSYGFVTCLGLSALFILVASIISYSLPQNRLSQLK